MIFDFLMLVVLAIWVITYIKKKRVILTLPYFLMIFITPIYHMLDTKIFLKIFGCGCVPSTQTNMLNIDFNANNLRFMVYNIMAIVITVLGLFLSKKIDSKKLKVIYVLTIFITNILLAFKICRMYMWR